jgi:hypothetical protein
MALNRSVTLPRMLLADHIRPVGVSAGELLEPHDKADHVLRSREAVEGFIDRRGIQTTPLVIIDAKRSTAARTSRFI